MEEIIKEVDLEIIKDIIRVDLMTAIKEGMDSKVVDSKTLEVRTGARLVLTSLAEIIKETTKIKRSMRVVSSKKPQR